MENMATGETVYLCVRLEFSQAHRAFLLRVVRDTHRVITKCRCSASKLLHVWLWWASAAFKWSFKRIIFPWCDMDANNVKDRSDYLLDNGNRYGCVYKNHTQYSCICWSWILWEAHIRLEPNVKMMIISSKTFERAQCTESNMIGREARRTWLLVLQKSKQYF